MHVHKKQGPGIQMRFLILTRGLRVRARLHLHRNAGALVSRSHRNAGASVPRSDRNAKASVPRSDRNVRASVPRSDCNARISIPMPNATPGPQFRSQIAMPGSRFRCPTQRPGLGSEVRSQCPDFDSDAQRIRNARASVPRSDRDARLQFRCHIHRKAGESVPRPQCCSTHTEVRQQLI